MAQFQRSEGRGMSAKANEGIVKAGSPPSDKRTWDAEM